MFLPFDRKPDWRNPPYITLFLIAVNVLIFAMFQTHDSAKFNAAYTYYMQSDLPETELRLYINYLTNNAQNNKAESFNQVLSQKKIKPKLFQSYVFDMLGDGSYKVALEQNKIMQPDNENYIHWKLQHDQFNDMLAQIPGYHYALFASNPDALALFTYQFLHADWSHLIGNMFFLFIFGFVLESALSRPIYLMSYILAGMGSGLFYIYLDPNSTAANIGASGSISGLVGIYTVIFGFRKIRFFYYILIYFNHVKAPAIILLPLWLFYDLSLQLWVPSNVNNIAHIGGLLSGAIIALIIKHFTSLVNINYVNEVDDNDNFLTSYNQALDFMSKLEFEQASAILQKLYNEDPTNSDVQLQLFNIAKHKPTSDVFHKQARNLLLNSNVDQVPLQLLYDIYKEYNHLAKPPKLSARNLFQLASKFSAQPYTHEAEKIMLVLIKKRPEFDKIPKGLTLLIKNYQLQNEQDKTTLYFNLLKKNYPNSLEAKQTVI